MREERLLERLRRWEAEPLSRGREDPKRTIDSVVRHLQRLLNTHQGSVEIAADYGIPDFMHFLQGGPKAALDVETAIRDVIEKYEPRLTGVRVRYIALEDGMPTLRFQIQARLSVDAKSVLLETIVGPDGRIQVKG